VNGFAHELEEKFATILDSFNIEYEYEPTTFIIKAHSNGDPKKGFTPDFYIPELDIYCELTAMNGSHCNRKRRKIEEIREIYGVKTLLFHRKRIEDILKKFSAGALDKEEFCDMLKL
jgi:hypoxanthine phosphoribosyltransferase